MYRDEKDKLPIEDFLNKSNPKIRKKYDFILQVIVNEAAQLKEPYVKHFTIEKYKMLYELRLKAAGTMVRIIYYEEGTDIIMLHAFIKKDKRDTVQALEYSLKLLESLKHNTEDICNRLKEVTVL